MLTSSGYFLTAIIAGVLLLLFFYYTSFILWRVANKVSGVKISLKEMFLLRLHKVEPKDVVFCMIEAHKANLQGVTCDKLKVHYLSGGYITDVVHAMITASIAGIELSFEKAAAIDLAGYNVFEITRNYVAAGKTDISLIDIIAENEKPEAENNKENTGS